MSVILSKKYIKSIWYFLYNISRLYCWDQLSQIWLFWLAGPEKKYFIINCHDLRIICTVTIINKPEYELGVQGHTPPPKKESVRGNLSGETTPRETGYRIFSKEKNHRGYRMTPESFSINFYRDNNSLLSMQRSNTRQSCCSSQGARDDGAVFEKLKERYLKLIYRVENWYT